MGYRQTVLILYSLFILFVLRVLGQLLVLFVNIPYLPPFRDWSVELVPYPVLLTAQILVIILLTKVCLDLYSKRGYFYNKHSWFLKPLLYFSIIYFLVMFVRFLIFGLSIPVVFHWVLASFAFVFSIYHIRRKTA